MLSVSWLPAAEFDIVTGGGGALSGELVALVGKTEEAIDRWRLEGRRAGFSGVTLTLPVPVRTLNLRGDGEVKASAGQVRLRVKALRPAASAPGQWALRAARYGAARVFYLDEHVWVEPGGFWTRAEADSSMVIDADQLSQPPTIWLRTGPVATTVDLSAGSWATHVAIEPQTRTSVTFRRCRLGKRRGW